MGCLLLAPVTLAGNKGTRYLSQTHARVQDILPLGLSLLVSTPWTHDIRCKRLPRWLPLSRY